MLLEQVLFCLDSAGVCYLFSKTSFQFACSITLLKLNLVSTIQVIGCVGHLKSDLQRIDQNVKLYCYLLTVEHVKAAWNNKRACCNVQIFH